MSAKQILVATDLSARSDRAIDRACMLADEWHAALNVVHVVPEKSWLNRKRTEAAQAVRELLPRHKADANVILMDGSAPEQIARAARDTGSSLILTGVARFNNFGDYVLGTAVEHVIRHSVVPVLVVKRRPFAEYNSIVVGIDLSEASLGAVIAAAEMFPNASLAVAHAFLGPSEAWVKSEEMRRECDRASEGEMEAFLSAGDLPDQVRSRITCTFGYGEVDAVIGKAIASVHAELLVLGKRFRSGVTHAVIGSWGDQLLRSVAVDTMVVPLSRE